MECEMFVDVFDEIHVEKRWFYLTQVSCKYYLGKEEGDPYRSTKGKMFTTKVVFLAAVARPCWGRTSNRIFDRFLLSSPSLPNSVKEVLATINLLVLSLLRQLHQ